MRRTAATVAMGLVWLVALAGPAAAHSVGGQSASNYQTRLLAVTPALPWADVKVIENGGRMELTNTGREQVVVLGYQEEPYLRVGPDGVFRNQRSPATYLNQDRKGTTAVPGSADPAATPVWKKVDDGQTVRWHDHRTHWMGDQDPITVRRDPGQRRTIVPEWRITLRQGTQTATVTGDLVWVPGPSPLPFAALAFVVFALTALAVLRLGPPAMMVATAVLVGIDMAHVIGVGLAAGGSVRTGMVNALAGSDASIIGWVAGIVGIWLLARRKPEGVYAVGFAGLLIAVNGGLVDLGDLSRSQIPSVLPDALVRVMVASSLGLGAGLAVATVVWVARRGRPAPAPSPVPEAATD